jgi:hypothetical protein
LIISTKFPALFFVFVSFFNLKFIYFLTQMENPLQKVNQYTTRSGGHPTPAPRTTHLSKETTSSVRWLIAPPKFMPVLSADNFTPIPSADDMVWTSRLVKSLQQVGLIGWFPLNLLNCMLSRQSTIIQKTMSHHFLKFVIET